MFSFNSIAHKYRDLDLIISHGSVYPVSSAVVASHCEAIDTKMDYHKKSVASGIIPADERPSFDLSNWDFDIIKVLINTLHGDVGANLSMDRFIELFDLATYLGVKDMTLIIGLTTI